MKSRLFPTKNFNKIPTPEPATESEVAKEPATKPEVATESIKATKAMKTKNQHKISSLKMRENFFNEIKNEEKSINEEIFNELFNYHYPSFLIKDLYEENKSKNDKIVRNINESLINLRNSINSKEIPENKSPNKIVNIVEIILHFDKQ